MMSDIMCLTPEAAAEIELRLQSIDLQAAMTLPARARGPLYSMSGTSAIIDITGPIAKHESWFTRFFGGTATTTVVEAIDAAAASTSASGILLRIDSPGGMVAGVADLADTVAAAGKRKPVHAYIEDLGASAAYWIGSQVSRLYSNSTARVGSIGTYAVIHDLSDMASKMGMKVHVLRAGEFKGAGTPGAPVTDEQLAAFQGVVNSINDLFLLAVSRGRNMPMPKVRELADGRVHVGEAAARLGLTDGVKSWAEVLSGIQKQAPAPRQKTAAEAWQEAVQAEGSTAAAAAKHPDLHRLFLAEYNLERGRVRPAEHVLRK